MEKQQKIFESRKRFDNALSLPDLVNEDSIASLIKEQLIQSSLRNNRGDVGKIVESRTKEVANFLEMLRSASGSGSSHLKFNKDWKVKQDTDQLRVMYCEGLHGSPFHTLLAEGFADGPMDVCLCVSWELTLYKKWWPQYTVPTFRIIASSCLEKVRIGEEISLIRMKVPWPVSDREAVLHYFEIEYFKEDLILILIRTLSDTEHIDADTHGFKSDGIPQAKDTVRIDLVGGVALQRVETNRCYFRAIFNFDIKLDFVPPSLINFISRQLVGNGHKLYQKAVGSVAATDADYREVLQGPLYDRIRRHLHSPNKTVTTSKDFDEEKLEEHKTDTIAKYHRRKTRTFVPEITEEDTEHKGNNIIANVSSENPVDVSSENPVDVSSENPVDKHRASSKEKASISPEVEHALGILDQAIALVRGKSSCKSSIRNDLPISELLAKASVLKNGDVPESSYNLKLKNNSERSPHTDDHRHRNMSSSIVETARTEVTLSSQKGIISESSQSVESKIIYPSKAYVRGAQPPAMDSHSISKVCDEESLKADGFYSSRRPFRGKTKKKKGKNLCLHCWSPSFFQD